ncbi:MAG: hypothetical protein ACJAYX_003409 [Planctomycetota bacterium]|jgi:hypothetical protein
MALCPNEESMAPVARYLANRVEGILQPPHN